MKRAQLEHAIRRSCQIIGHDEIIVVRSQAILGTYDEFVLPSTATSSVEIDVLPMADDHEETVHLGDRIVGAAGEWSIFDQEHGFNIGGVDLGTVTLPESWRSRLVKVQNENTAAPGGTPQYIGWCLDKEDLCVAKLCVHRAKDLNFVRALLEAEPVDGSVIADRLGTCQPNETPGSGRLSHG